MSNKIAPLRGMKDLLPKEYAIHQHIIDIAQNMASLYGYKNFSTPILENASVFDRTLGESSDVISKEIYCFKDKKNRLLALRPEFTASIIRAFISNGLKHKLPQKLFSHGPVFRYDRPQEGRQRQFHQLNFEYIGAYGAYSDAETIELASNYLTKLGIRQDVVLELNSLGCTESRNSYQASLIEYFMQYENDLSDDSKNRLKKNPLRILDSKDLNDQKIALDAPNISQYYTKYSCDYFDQVKCLLGNMNIDFVVNQRLARGLDYYSHTAFEFTTDKLGAQGTILAGGRYDNLTKLMGESEIPSIGFAAGIERISLMKEFEVKSVRPICIIPIGDDMISYAIKIASLLREGELVTEVHSEGKINKKIQSAINKNAKYLIFIGEDERTEGNCKIKNLDKNMEHTISVSNIVNFIMSE